MEKVYYNIYIIAIINFIKLHKKFYKLCFNLLEMELIKLFHCQQKKEDHFIYKDKK